MSLDRYEAGLAARRRAYLDWILEHFSALEPGMEPADGRRWALNHVRLRRGVDLEQANAWFAALELPRDSDLYFIRFLKTLLDPVAAPKLSAAARARLTEVLTGWPRHDLSSVARWPCLHTENHDLTHLAIGLFARQHLGENLSAHEQQLQQALAWRFERGFVEWNSACYQYHYSNPLLLLADHAPSAALRTCAASLLNVLLAERAVLGVQGFLGGPSFRCRTADAHNSLTDRPVAYPTDARYDGFLPTVWLALGLGEPRFVFDEAAAAAGLLPATTEYASANEPRLKQDEGMFFACSGLVPHPAVVALAAEATAHPPLVYRGRRFLGWPGPDLGEQHWETQRWMPAALEYYNTPHVSLGSVHSCGWICQNRYNKVVFPAQPAQGLRVELILPGVPPHKRRYEAHGRCVQHRGWLLGQGTLFEDGGLTAGAAGPWRLYRVGRGLCAHYALPESYHVLQVSDLDRWGSEEAFLAALTRPRWEGQQVQARELDGDRLTVNLEDMSLAVNGTPRPHPPPRLHDCACLRAEYGSGEITVCSSVGTFTFTARGVPGGGSEYPS